MSTAYEASHTGGPRTRLTYRRASSRQRGGGCYSLCPRAPAGSRRMYHLWRSARRGPHAYTASACALRARALAEYPRLRFGWYSSHAVQGQYHTVVRSTRLPLWARTFLVIVLSSIPPRATRGGGMLLKVLPLILSLFFSCFLVQSSI